MNNDIGIYIHIPFCISKCFYCNFCSWDNKNNLIEKYIDALIKEIITNSEILSLRKIKTIYIGGGTPTYIDASLIRKIMEVLKLFGLDSVEEITIECNPNSITEEKLNEYIEIGINRFSIGLQATDNKVLKAIGRSHTFEDYINILKLLNKYNIKNISSDIIYPLPHMTINDFKDSINKIIEIGNKYNVNHFSIYNLELHEGSKLEFLINEGYLTLADEDEEYEMKQYLENSLKENGYIKYEISNFAKAGYESIHNTNYWKQKEYLGFGVNASSFMNGKRYTNTKNIEDYISYYLNDNIDVQIKIEEEEMDKLSLMKEYIILTLRMTSGLSKEVFPVFGG